MVRLSNREKARMGQRVRAAREVAELGLRQVARQFSVSTSTVSAWERGSVPAPEVRAQLADLYGVSEELLFSEYMVKRATELDEARALLARPA